MKQAYNFNKLPVFRNQWFVFRNSWSKNVDGHTSV